MHTHFAVAQINAQSKTAKRVCKPTHTTVQWTGINLTRHDLGKTTEGQPITRGIFNCRVSGYLKVSASNKPYGNLKV